MALVAWVKRHYYHYTISTGIYAFYPFERFVVNIFTVIFFSLMAYYTARSVWLGAVFIGDLVLLFFLVSFAGYSRAKERKPG